MTDKLDAAALARMREDDEQRAITILLDRVDSLRAELETAKAALRHTEAWFSNSNRDKASERFLRQKIRIALEGKTRPDSKPPALSDTTYGKNKQ